MKLNYKRTLLVGTAFFLITAFWQAYDAIIPLILTNHFGLPHMASGAVMSLDNVLAVFLLPFFGALSDRVNTRLGRRTPFILVGAIAAMLSFFALTLIDGYQITHVLQTALATPVPEGELARKTLELTLENPLPLVCFILALLAVLLSMAAFRSPAVALMPDVTPKPLRSKANAVINLMG